MTTLREAAQQALEVLESGLLVSHHAQVLINLRAALEQPEQEPVIWAWSHQLEELNELGSHKSIRAWANTASHRSQGLMPLYTHPPRREWRGLTDAERAAVQYESFKRGLSPLEFMELHEAKLKERNA